MTNAQNASTSSTPVPDDPSIEPTRLHIGVAGLGHMGAAFASNPCGEGSAARLVRGGASLPMPVAGLVHDRLVAMMARGWADLDWAALGLLAAFEAGLDGEPRGKS